MPGLNAGNSREHFARLDEELLDSEFLVEFKPRGDFVSRSIREHFQEQLAVVRLMARGQRGCCLLHGDYLIQNPTCHFQLADALER